MSRRGCGPLPAPSAGTSLSPGCRSNPGVSSVAQRTSTGHTTTSVAMIVPVHCARSWNNAVARLVVARTSASTSCSSSASCCAVHREFPASASRRRARPATPAGPESRFCGDRRTNPRGNRPRRGRLRPPRAAHSDRPRFRPRPRPPRDSAVPCSDTPHRSDALARSDIDPASVMMVRCTKVVAVCPVAN